MTENKNTVISFREECSMENINYERSKNNYQCGEYKLTLQFH